LPLASFAIALLPCFLASLVLKSNISAKDVAVLHKVVDSLDELKARN
jgi:hypothetical protein